MVPKLSSRRAYTSASPGSTSTWRIPTGGGLLARNARRPTVGRRRRSAAGRCTTFTATDRSAFSGKRRPAYEALCEDIKNHVIDAVIVWDVDRLHRNPPELEDFVTLIESVVSVSGGDYDLENADGRFKATAPRQARRARRYRKLNGERPYGCKRVGLEHDPAAGGSDTRRQVAEPAEAAVVAEMVEWVARGETLSAIAGKLNARGVPTRQGGPWIAETVGGIVASWRGSSGVGERVLIAAANARMIYLGRPLPPPPSFGDSHVLDRASSPDRDGRECSPTRASVARSRRHGGSSDVGIAISSGHPTRAARRADAD